MLPNIQPQVALKIIEEALCNECGKYYIAPETASCGHTLCHGCWRGFRSCPICAAPLNRRSLQLDLTLQKISEHVHTFGDAFEKLFNIKLNKIMNDNKDHQTDPTKHVKEWLTSSQNHFSAPVLDTQFSTELPNNPIELSTSKIQIHSENVDTKGKTLSASKLNKNSVSNAKKNSSQDDWDKIEVLSNSEDNINKKQQEKITSPTDLDPYLIEEDAYTNENPRRSSRKKDISKSDALYEAFTEKTSSKNSTNETEKRSAKSKQTWSNVNKMKKEFSKLNKKTRSKLNVSIEMCKKTHNIVSKPVAAAESEPIMIDENTPDLRHNENNTLEKDSANDHTNNKINNNKISVVNEDKQQQQSKSALSPDKLENVTDREKNVNTSKDKDVPLTIVKQTCESSKNNDVITDMVPSEVKKISFIKKSFLDQEKANNNIQVTQTECTSNTVASTDDIEISIKIGTTITNIVIKKKDSNVQLKVNANQEIQTSLGPYTINNKTDASCSPIKEKIVEPESDKCTPMSKSTTVKKNTDSADTATANFEITESVEKELSDLMEYVETNKVLEDKLPTSVSKSKIIGKTQTLRGPKTFKNAEDDDLEEADIFGSGSVKEANVVALIDTKKTQSEIIPTFKTKATQQSKKRIRDINDDISMSNKKKIKIAESPKGLKDSISDKNKDGEMDSDNYDAIMSQVFANIDAEISNKNQKKNLPYHTQNIQAGQALEVKEIIDQKYSENVFSILDKDSESIDNTKVSNKEDNEKSTQENIKNLLTPGVCRDLEAPEEPSKENEDVEMMVPDSLGTPMMNHDDDSDKSVVEETPQKSKSFIKPKQITDQDKNKAEISKDNEKTDSQIIKSIINISDSEESTRTKNTTIVDMTKKALETPLSMGKFFDHIKHNSTPVARKSLNFSENLDDPEQTLCPTTTQEKEILIKAFEQTQKSPVKRPLGLKNIKTRENQNFSIAGSCLTAAETSRLKILCSNRGWSYVDKYTKELTHLVVGIDEENKSQRSVKYMCALAASKWIVSFAWVEKCLQLNEVVYEAPHEVLDACGEPGPRRSRMATRKLFEGYTFFCMPPFSVLDLDTLKYILEAAGGRVVDSAKEVTVMLNDQPSLLLAEPEHTQEDRFIYLTVELCVVPVNYEWVLNCLGNYNITSILDLLLCPSTLLPRATEKWPHALLSEDDD